MSPGVFAYVQLDGSWGLNNTGFLLGRKHVLAIDTCFTERRTRALIDALRSRAGTRPVRVLVNTHHHGDHTFGNYLLAGEATIVGHELCREALLREGFAAHRLFPGVEWGTVELAPPEVTFRDRLGLWLDDLRVELIHVGPAHTTNDVVAWIPERKVLYTGDVVFNGGTPFALAGSVAGWLEALDRLRALGAETIVPGHGAVCGPQVFDDIEAYLRLRAGRRDAAASKPASPRSMSRATSTSAASVSGSMASASRRTSTASTASCAASRWLRRSRPRRSRT